MKKIIFATYIAVVLVIAGIGAQTVSAAASDTTITGNVSDHGNVVPGAKIYAVCEPAGLPPIHRDAADLTDIHGNYTVIYTASECPLRSTVHVVASEGNRSGSSTGVVNSINHIAIAIVNIGIPEFGQISGILTIATGTGLIVLTRQRHIHRNNYRP